MYNIEHLGDVFCIFLRTFYKYRSAYMDDYPKSYVDDYPKSYMDDYPKSYMDSGSLVVWILGFWESGSLDSRILGVWECRILGFTL